MAFVRVRQEYDRLDFTFDEDGMAELHIEYNKFGANQKRSEYSSVFSGQEVGRKPVQDVKREFVGWDQGAKDTEPGGLTKESTRGGNPWEDRRPAETRRVNTRGRIVTPHLRLRGAQKSGHFRR
jgi:hypothetical protein